MRITFRGCATSREAGGAGAGAAGAAVAVGSDTAGSAATSGGAGAVSGGGWARGVEQPTTSETSARIERLKAEDRSPPRRRATTIP